MTIAAVMNAHSPELIKDTTESILAYVTEDILVLSEGSAWEDIKKVPVQAHKMRGFHHPYPKAPYRNVALALKSVVELFPDRDWYCYCESDVLFGSARFKRNLQIAAEKKVWMLGNDGRVDHVNLPFIESMLGQKFKGCYYLLGCCMFFHRDYIKELVQLEFFDRFLHLTASFSENLPFYTGYDISEHLYPTMCRHFGGNIGVFANYEQSGLWHGSYQYFPVRWKPELDPEKENFLEASILHPLKGLSHPIRVYHREKRKEVYE